MEKITEGHTPNSTRVLNCTPDQLRIIADRMDAEARGVTQNGEYILYPLSESVTLFYSPNKEKK